MENIKSFWYISKNVGDTLTPFIVEHFTGRKVDHVPRDTRGKLIAVGSIMKALRRGDVVWGAGVMREYDKFLQADKATFLAVRGKLSEKILGIKCGVYGDPALLLPLIYNPKIEKKHKVAVISHYVETDEPVFKKLKNHGTKFIDVLQDWRTFVDEVLSCEKIVSSSLHGVIIAEAYGVPAIWVKPSEKVLGSGFKFRDYLSGTNRELPENIGGSVPTYKFPPIENLKEIQDKLIESLQNHYGKR